MDHGEKERQQLISACDCIVDTYHAGRYTTGEDLTNLITMRRSLTANGSSLASHTKPVHGQAGLSYLMRKYRIAESIIDARASDAKKAMNIMEQEAMKMPSVVAAQKEEIWAEAEKEMLKTKLDWYKQVLSSMQQEISLLGHELRHANYQSQGA